MIHLDDGLVRGGLCVWGTKLGWICEIGRRTYRIRWMGGEFTTQLRPDLDEEVA